MNHLGFDGSGICQEARGLFHIKLKATSMCYRIPELTATRSLNKSFENVPVNGMKVLKTFLKMGQKFRKRLCKWKSFAYKYATETKP